MNPITAELTETYSHLLPHIARQLPYGIEWDDIEITMRRGGLVFFRAMGLGWADEIWTVNLVQGRVKKNSAKFYCRNLN
jgi:hypothetical protein